MSYYEPNASGIITSQEAMNLGTKVAEQSQAGIDLGANLQQQIMKTQLMHQQVQQKMMENQSAMTNHVADGFNDLANWENPNSPMWKYKFQQTMNNAKQIGFPIDPNAMDAYLKDDTTRGQFAAAFGKLNDPSLSPTERAQALQQAVYATGKDPGDIAKLSDNMLDAYAKVVSAKAKGSSSMDLQANKVREQVKSVNQKWDGLEEFSQNAMGILNDKDLSHSGIGQTQLKEAFTRAGSGGAIRSFTLSLMDSNRNLANKFQGAINKLETGGSLTDQELSYMKEGLKVASRNTGSYREKELEPYYNSAKQLVSRAKLGGSELDPNTMMPRDQWNRFVDKEQGTTFNSDTGKYENTNTQKTPTKSSKPQVQNSYKVGSDSSIDNVIKIMTKNGKSRGYISKILSDRGFGQLSEQDFNDIKGK